MSSVFQLSSAADRPRLRPGERPYWFDAGADSASFERWRTEAERAGLVVDAWVALLLELELVMDDLRPLGNPEELLRSAVEADSSLLHLCSSKALRTWSDSPGARPCHDDLPELLLPERLAMRLPHGTPLGSRLNPELTDLARACERRAAVQCRTLESWVLSTVIAGLPDCPPHALSASGQAAAISAGAVPR